MAVTALFTGAPLAVAGKPGDVDLLSAYPTGRNNVGLRAMGYDTTGNVAEYIYLSGIASTIVGSVVIYNHLGVTSLNPASGVGPIAVATGLTVASSFGWYGIAGTFLTDVVANTAIDAKLGRETTDGKVGDGFAAGDQIVGAYSRVATTAAAVVLCQYLYPLVGINVA